MGINTRPIIMALSSFIFSLGLFSTLLAYGAKSLFIKRANKIISSSFGFKAPFLGLGIRGWPLLEAAVFFFFFLLMASFAYKAEKEANNEM